MCVELLLFKFKLIVKNMGLKHYFRRNRLNEISFGIFHINAYFSCAIDLCIGTNYKGIIRVCIKILYICCITVQGNLHLLDGRSNWQWL